MITYLINSFLCSLIFYLAYIFLLEDENIHHFKRGYLLFSLIFSLIIPLIQFKTQPAAETTKQATAVITEFNEIQYTINESIEQTATLFSDNLSNYTHINFSVITILIYFSIVSVLLFRFMLNILSIHKRKRQGIVLPNQNADLILMKEKIIPHSFGKYIFINQEDYENELIVKEIITHECSHIKQRHFLDIIFMELLIIFFWFNPIFYLYRNKIKLNHEFLADNAVIRKIKDVSFYQTLLINMACRQKSSIITSSLNYLLTKKRFIMMTKTTSKKKACCRIFALIPLFFMAIVFFTTKITANILPEQFSELDATADETVIIPGKGLTAEELDEYKRIVDKYYVTIDRSGKSKEKGFCGTVLEEDHNRMYILYVQMNSEQRKKQIIIFSGVLTPFELRSPNVSEWNNCKKKKTIFLDGEQVETEKLNALSRNKIVFFTYNNENSSSFLWTKEGLDNYVQKYGKQISTSELMKTHAFLVTPGNYVWYVPPKKI